jgi:general secretion pathway protein G
MIELIFVIVVIGIIAGVAMPKLIGVRDDARIVTELDTVSNTMRSIVNIYNAQQIIETNETFSDCFRIYSHETNGSMYLGVEDKNNGSTLPDFCPIASKEASRNGLLGQFVVKVKGASLYAQ